MLDGGRISAEGRHADLLQTSELYRQLAAQLTECSEGAATATGTDRP